MTLKKDMQILKFGFYGLLKNLKFFEPFLWLYFIINDLSYLEIGTLYAIREAIVYIFEIPSGVMADRFGKKNELILCFIFYILSFVMFYLSNSFVLFVIAMSFYGLGEAFRSGTHKAMIMQYLDHMEIKESKTKVYGMTRSYSNIGSAISSLAGIALMLITPDLSYLFLIAIIPYILDLGLILSYPNYLNQRIDTTFRLKDFLKENVQSVKYALTKKKLNKVILKSSSFNAIFKTIKDYIQPIMLGLGITFLLFTDLSRDENVKIYVGVIYFVVHFINVFVTRYAYTLQKYISKNMIIRLMWILTGVVSVTLGLFIDNIIIVILSFLLFYIFLNIRKPYMVEKIGDCSDSTKRASVLSIDSQLTSLMIIVFAPVLGFIGDTYSIGVMMISLGVFMLVLEVVFPKEKGA